MTEAVAAVLKFCVIVLLFAIGTDSDLRDIRYLLHDRGLLLRSVVAMYVLVPLAALAIIWSVALEPGLQVALLVIAISAGAPLLPRKLMKFGHPEYAFGLVVVTSMLAIITVPASLAILARLFGRTDEIAPGPVAVLIGTTFLLPLIAGMIVAKVVPSLAARMGEPLTYAAGTVFAACAVGMLILHSDIVIAAGWRPFLVLVGMAGCALLIGHVCGGPHPDGRSMLAVACATRHVGLAVLLAVSVREQGAALLVPVYVVAAAVLAVPYVYWRRRATA